jgi:hypothetical protein
VSLVSHFLSFCLSLSLIWLQTINDVMLSLKQGICKTRTPMSVICGTYLKRAGRVVFSEMGFTRNAHFNVDGCSTRCAWCTSCSSYCRHRRCMQSVAWTWSGCRHFLLRVCRDVLPARMSICVCCPYYRLLLSLSISPLCCIINVWWLMLAFPRNDTSSLDVLRRLKEAPQIILCWFNFFIFHQQLADAGKSCNKNVM